MRTIPEILFVTSYPPRECGIATYSQDLVNALQNQFSRTFNCSICALETEHEMHNYRQKPRYIINTGKKNDFIKIAFEINRNKNIAVVVIQHEFGFFASSESEFELFYCTINKPVVFVFHTVLPNPTYALKQKVQAMVNIASSIIVMTQNASHILITDYKVPSNKINVIPHGTHLAPTFNKLELKKKYDFNNRKVLATFGLLSANKGIEVTLNALPDIIKRHPNVLFLILGKTHPVVKKREGEKYRESLESIVKQLKIENHVVFINEYLPLPKLLEYLQLTDIYLFTSNDPNQAVSGTFSYAMSAGCPIISTPIPHAKELLNQHTGLFFDFKNIEQLSNAVIYLLNEPLLAEKISSNALHQMAPTAWENAAIAHTKLFKKLSSIEMELKYAVPPININHIQKMTTKFGMLQFAKIAQPDTMSGYTLDDNSRALISIGQLYETTKDPSLLIYIHTYVKFIKYCFQVGNNFINYVDVEQYNTSQNDHENLEDSNGRAIWALGFIISLKHILPFQTINEAELLINKVKPHLEKIHSTRAMAFIIKGLCYQNDINNDSFIQLFADRLVQMYRHERKIDWLWFENYLTYGNSVIPEAMLMAYLRTNNSTYKHIAKESFDFLLSKIFANNQIKVISNKGWLHNNSIQTTPIGGEQPIDVAYTIIALEKFSKHFREEAYIEKAIVAFDWFLGNNHLNQIVYNPCTGGCYDGIEEFNVNLNQGAESTLSYLMARLTIDQILNINIRSTFLNNNFDLPVRIEQLLIQQSQLIPIE